MILSASKIMREAQLTDDIPMMLRNTPDPKYIARASETPIANAKTKAVETEGSSFLSLSFASIKLLSAYE